jgi:uncharacterized DUF497 family protein
MYDWDARKSQSNRRKHGVSFEEAATVRILFSTDLFADYSKSTEARPAKIGRADTYLFVRGSEAIERNEAYASFSVVCYDKEKQR